MSLSGLASVGSLVSGMAVLVSLIVLYIQLPQIHAQVLQAEKNQRALMNQGVLSRGVSLGVFLTQTRHVTAGTQRLSLPQPENVWIGISKRTSDSDDPLHGLHWMIPPFTL